MYSLALDNSWLVMNEDEMYEVNGGGSITITLTEFTRKQIQIWGYVTAVGVITTIVASLCGLTGIGLAIAPIVAAGVTGLVTSVLAEKYVVGSKTYTLATGWLLPNLHLGTI